MPRATFPEFGQRLTALMEARGITNQSEFARSLGLIPAKIGRWRRGSLPESQAELEMVAAVLRVPWQWLLVGDQCAESLIAYRENRWTPPPQQHDEPTARAPGRTRVAQRR